MKKFIVSTDSLKPALKKVGQAVNNNSVMPVLKNIYCKVTNNQLEMITTDMELTISYKVDCETGASQEFDILLPYDFINKIVAFSGSIPLSIEQTSARKAKIIADADVYDIGSLDKVEDFPAIPETPKKKVLPLDKNFTLLLSNALATVSKDEIRPAICRVLFDVAPDTTYIVSTDGFSVYRHALKITTEEKEQIQFSYKMVKALDGIESFELSWTQKVIALKSEKLTIWNTRFEDKYPDYKVIIPNYTANLQLNKLDFKSALHKALITGDSRTTSIFLKNEKGFIQFETIDSDFERNIHSKIAGDYKGTVNKIAINAKRMLTILDQNDSDEVNLHIHGDTKAVLVSCESDKDYLGLIMPLTTQ